jgi:tetratricopeptide repeat protein
VIEDVIRLRARMTLKKLLVGVLVVGLAVGATRVVFADDAAEAKLHYQRGLAAYGLNDYATAASEYEAAFKLKPDPALLYNAAQAHRLAGNKPRALALYQNYLTLFGGDAPNRETVERRILELKQAIEVERSKQPPPAAPAESPPPKPAEQPAAAGSSQPTAASLTTSPPEPRRQRPKWVWGVVAAAGVVVVAGAITLGVVLGSHTNDPNASFGAIPVQ